MPTVNQRPLLPGVFLLIGLLPCLVPCPLPCEAAAGEDETPPIERQLILRKWDLNGDGSIDEEEAEVARARMRRERAALRAKAVVGATDEEEHAEPVPEREPGLQPADTDPLGTGVEEPPDVTPGKSRKQTSREHAEKTNATSRRAEERRSPVVTGGARAGGLARPGYGSNVPRGELNAGRPLPPRSVGQRPPMTGGLLPAPRRAPLGARPPVAPPRVTAEDMPY
jgi:hypothetical protein